MQVVLFLCRTGPIPAKTQPSSGSLDQALRYRGTSNPSKSLSAWFFYYFYFLVPEGNVVLGVSSQQGSRTGFSHKAVLFLPGSHTLKPLTSDFVIPLFLLLVLTLLIPGCSVAHSAPCSSSLPPSYRPVSDPTNQKQFLY